VARKRYTAEQIIGHLRQAEIRASEGKTIAEVVRELGISEQTTTGGARNTVAWRSIRRVASRSWSKRTGV
jgi:hypothetical protein